MAIRVIEFQFDKEAQLLTPQNEQAAVLALNALGADGHAIVISHGWNNDMDEARTLYRAFLGHLEQIAGAGASRIIALGILWPSKRFTDAELIPGGAASADTDPTADLAITQRLEELKHVFSDPAADKNLDAMKALVSGLSTDPIKQRQFVALLGEIADRHLDDGQRTPDEGQARLSQQDGAKVLRTFGAPIIQKPSLAGAGGAAGVGLGDNPAVAANPALGRTGGPAAGIGDFFTGIKAGALRLLNFATYQTMKDRAGIVGKNGVNAQLHRIQSQVPNTIHFHLVGHSFGGRVVTATVDGPQSVRANTLLLLQAAYSHNGLAQNFDGHGANGFFEKVLSEAKVNGSILITHSKHDRAVGLAYPLASRLNGDDAAGIGDKDDRFGGMGANGAQHIDPKRLEMPLQPVGAAYDFTTGQPVINLNGDAFISSHGDVARPETAYVLAKVMGF
jgi:hypothetical protein